MATKDKEPKEQKKGKGGGNRKGEAPKAGARRALATPAPTPRLHTYYHKTVRERLSKQFELKNPHEIPGLEKIVLNVGLGEAIKQPKLLDKVVEELGVITGQRPVRKKAKKSIANFGLREGQEIGASVTLRGARMWEFLDRFISTAVPRIRDFRGLSHALVRRSRELLARREGADDLSRDQLRHGRPDPRDGHHVRHDDGEGRPGVRAAARAWNAVPRRRQADRRSTQPRISTASQHALLVDS